MKQLAESPLNQKLTWAGYATLVIFAISSRMPIIPLGNESSIWTSPTLYIFIVTAIAAPILFKRANTIKPTRANTIGFWISMIPLLLLAVLILGLVIAFKK